MVVLAVPIVLYDTQPIWICHGTIDTERGTAACITIVVVVVLLLCMRYQ